MRDLFEDLRDGHNLISLLEVLSGEHLPRERGRLRFHMLQNVQLTLDFLRYRKVSYIFLPYSFVSQVISLPIACAFLLHFFGSRSVPFLYYISQLSLCYSRFAWLSSSFHLVMIAFYVASSTLCTHFVSVFFYTSFFFLFFLLVLINHMVYFLLLPYHLLPLFCS